MKTKLLFMLFIGFNIHAQTTVLKNEQLDNVFEIKLDKRTDGKIDGYINDSKKPNVSERFSVNENTPLTIINSKILKIINDGSKGFYYFIPKSDPKVSLNVDVEKEKIKEEDIVIALKKLDQPTLKSLLKNRLDTKLEFSKYIEKIKNVNDTQAVFPEATSTSGYMIKRIAADKVALFFDGASVSEFNSSDEKDFYQKLYDKVKTDDITLKALYATELLKNIKNVAIDSDENALALEGLHAELKGKEKIMNYSYLGYIGTNFDLVDGVKAKNLFFAANILVTPKAKERAGFYISLYGNRTISRIDSIPNIVRDVRVIDSIGNQYIHREKSDVVKKVQSDNLGAYFSPLIRWNFWRKRDNLGAVRTSPASFYFAPSLEFIWRRTDVDVRYINTKKLPAEQLTNLQPTYSNNLSYHQNNTYNIYDFYISPVGFWLLHENETISIRLNMNVGYSTRYAPINYLNTSSDIDMTTIVQDTYSNTNDIFYTGKLWITERTTGITLQGEINNTLKRSTPFYGVTLSKAFDFDKLGNFFEPISNRKTVETK